MAVKMFLLHLFPMWRTNFLTWQYGQFDFSSHRRQPLLHSSAYIWLKTHSSRQSVQLQSLAPENNMQS